MVMTSLAGGDAKRQFRALSWQARLMSTKHPHVFYWSAGLQALFFAVIGAVLMSRTVLGGVVNIVIGIVGSAFTALPGWWSERHRQEAAHAVDVRVGVRNRAARRHPLYFVVVIPLVVAADAAVRWNRNHTHHSAVSWLVPAAVGLVFGPGVGGAMIVRARRAGTYRVA
jgi:hypothetical protein